MACFRTVHKIIAAVSMVGMISGFAASTEELPATPLDRIVASYADDNAPRTADQQALVDFALARFEAHHLDLPDVGIQFYESLQVCGGHKGLYVHETLSLHMCSIDKATILHELAHAWANTNMSEERQAEFTQWRGLDTWNDHDHAWEERATEHVAETFTWALLDEPNHVRWVEQSADGSNDVTHRILTLNVDVETLAENFVWLTGQDPEFRSPTDWEVNPDSVSSFSPEARRG